SLPIATLVSGIDSMAVLEQNLKIVRDFTPLSVDERRAIEDRVRLVAGDGRYELFQTTKVYDGPVHRTQHGFSTEMA
ncbi:MAG TPA: aldo/keto reductase, partial [Isosphaeraceae bacterium]